MKTDSLSEVEIAHINNVTQGMSLNDKKTYLQTLIVNKSLRDSNKFIVLCLFTGFGKTTTALIYLDRYMKKHPDGKKLKIVVPSKNLKKAWLKKRDFYSVNVINSFTMTLPNEDKNVDFLIVDEVHHALGEESKFFNTTLDFKAEYKLGLSASLDERKLKRLEEKGCDYVFKLSVEDGSKLGIVPDVKIINVPVVLSPSEKMMYHANEQELEKNSKLFTTITMHSYENKEFLLRRLCVNLLSSKDKTFNYQGIEVTSKELTELLYQKLVDNKIPISDKSVIIGLANKINSNFLKRDSILDNCTDKVSAVNQLLKIIEKRKGSIENLLIFSKSIAFLDLLSAKLNSVGIKSAVLHSNLPPKKINNTLEAFELGYYKVLLSIGMIKEGYDLETIDTVIRTAYNGTVLDAEQIIGRALRYDKNNPDKVSAIFNLYVDTFIYREKEYESVEANKLEHAYVNYDVTWVDNINHINDTDE